MNYSNLFKKFREEIKCVCQYKHLDHPFRSFAVVATLPFWFMCAFIICLKYVYLFFFNCFAASADYLEKWVKETKKDVNPWTTEAVIYLVTMPVVFFLRCILSLFGSVFYLAWFFAMCLGYLASLAGIRWQPFISVATFEDNVKVKATTNKLAANIIIMIGFILFCLTLLLLILRNESADLYQASSILLGLYFVFMILSIPITFRNKVVAVDGSEEIETNKVSMAKNDFEEEFPDF